MPQSAVVVSYGKCMCSLQFFNCMKLEMFFQSAVSFYISTSNAGVIQFLSVQFSHSVVSDICDPMDCSTPGLPAHHRLLEFTQAHVH